MVILNIWETICSGGFTISTIFTVTISPVLFGMEMVIVSPVALCNTIWVVSLDMSMVCGCVDIGTMMLLLFVGRVLASGGA